MNAADPQPVRARHGFARLLWLALGLLAFHSAATLPAPESTGRTPSIASVQALAAPARPGIESRATDRAAIDLGDDLLPPGDPRAASEPAPAAGLAAVAPREGLLAGRVVLPFRARAPPARA